MKIKILGTALILAIFPITSHAVVLVDSTFTNSAIGAGGRNATNSSNLTPWFLISNTTANNATVVDDNVGGGLGKSMNVLGLHSVYTAFSTASLLIGETITLTLSYRFTATPATSSETFRIGLYNANSAAAITADQASISDANEQQYVGYYAGLAIGVNPSGSGTVIRQRDTNNSNALTSSSQSSAIGSNNSGVVSGTTAHTLEYAIERTNATTLSITTKIDGVTMLNVTDSTSIYTSFNSLAIAGVGGAVNIDSILLQTVPEPGTWLLVALGTGFVLFRTRRRLA